MEKNKIKVYFDGLCQLCSREIDHYRKIQGSESIGFIDITQAEFDATKEGLDPKAIHREIHVRRVDGTILTGVDGFIEIWRQLPLYNLLANIAVKPIPHMVLNIGYKAFAKARPYLPKRKRDCSQSPYCESK